MKDEEKLIQFINEFSELEIQNQIDYEKFYLYSIITHSTAIEGSTVTELENQMLFDEGITAKGRSMQEQLMNLDLKNAYQQGIEYAKQNTDFSVEMLQTLASLVMEKTGTEYSTMRGAFSSKKGDLRLLNVTAGTGGKSYVSFEKVPSLMQDFCNNVNQQRHNIQKMTTIEQYKMSFDAHYDLVTIHPWADGNGRMSRLIMNQLQFECGIIPSFIKKENKADYIQSLIDTREQKDKEIIRTFLLSEHCNNLESILSEYKKSMNTFQDKV